MSAATENTESKSISLMTLGAIGIVFGDIGTSPLYAMKECFSHGLPVNAANVLGVVSLIFWSITVIVSLKYAFIVLRADNRGEGGSLALMALAMSGARRRGGTGRTVALIGLCGAALFFGDSMITPAISVLSAVEGLNVAAPQLKDIILPAAVLILVMLFMFQSQGTQRVGNFFGPIIVLWFFVMGLMGVRAILNAPEILAALNPAYALMLVGSHGWMSFAILGAVLLAFTGVEALYADLGHFGKFPIRLAWFGLAMPALMLNYFGQGALLLKNPGAVGNPFYLLVPDEFMLSMVGLAALATVIASQAVISGAFSIVQQAMQLDYLPRFTIRHTSADSYGQIYMPQINWILCFGVLLLVVLFRSSDALANAYGFSVVGTMVATTLLVFVVMRDVWRWPLLLAALILGPFLAVDLTFFATAAAKIPDGGWLPLAIGSIIFLLFVTWRQGRQLVLNNRRNRSRRLDSFLATVTPERPMRIPGTAVFLSSVATMMPPALSSNLHHNKVLHERVLVLTVLTEESPRVPDEERISISAMGKGFWQATLHYGFMEQPDVVNDLQTYMLADCPIELRETSFFIGHAVYVPGDHPLRPRWREDLFLWMSNHSVEAFEYFRIPTNRIVELGVQIEV